MTLRLIQALTPHNPVPFGEPQRSDQACNRGKHEHTPGDAATDAVTRTPRRQGNERHQRLEPIHAHKRNAIDPRIDFVIGEALTEPEI